MLTCENLSLPQDTLRTSAKERIASEPIENLKPGHHHKILEVAWLHMMHMVLQVVVDKVPAYPTTKNVKEVQTFVRTWVLEGLLFFTWHSAHIPYTTC